MNLKSAVDSTEDFRINLVSYQLDRYNRDS